MAKRPSLSLPLRRSRGGRRTDRPAGAPPLTRATPRPGGDGALDLQRRRDQLGARVAELQFDLGGLVYDMAIRDQLKLDVIVARAALLQGAEAELAEVERILRLEQTSTAGTCGKCGAPHSLGAAFCWQCGNPILEPMPAETVARSL